MNMRVLVFAVLVGSLLWSDLEQKVESRVRLSMAVGDSHVQYRTQPICPYVACSQCANTEILLKLVVNKGGTVKQVTVVQGNSILAEAAVDAVKQWRYRSYVQNGSAVEFETHALVKSWKCGT